MHTHQDFHKSKPADLVVTVINILQIIAAAAVAIEAIIRFVSFIASLKKTIGKHHMGFNKRR